jgi:hypothetical protein
MVDDLRPSLKHAWGGKHDRRRATDPWAVVIEREGDPARVVERRGALQVQRVRGSPHKGLCDEGGEGGG